MEQKGGDRRRWIERDGDVCVCVCVCACGVWMGVCVKREGKRIRVGRKKREGEIYLFIYLSIYMHAYMSMREEERESLIKSNRLLWKP